jgi:hypothetical protein
MWKDASISDVPDESAYSQIHTPFPTHIQESLRLWVTPQGFWVQDWPGWFVSAITTCFQGVQEEGCHLRALPGVLSQPQYWSPTPEFEWG